MSSYSPDFIERNSAFLLSAIGIVAGCAGGLVAYLLKSRCTSLRCCCVECIRQPLTAQELEIVTAATSSREMA